MPLISVIVPVYKVEPYLHRCVDSILTQTFTDFELILVDDGSPDNCGVICDEYAAQDLRVQVIHQENQGLPGARNAGLDIARGEYVIFCDSDDYWDENLLKVTYAKAEEETADCVVFNCCYVNEDGSIQKKETQRENTWTIESDGDRLDYLLGPRKTGWELCFRLLRRDIIENNNIRGCMTCKGYAEDLAFTTVYGMFARKICYIDQHLYYYFQRSDSIMGQSQERARLNELNEVSMYIWEYYKRRFPGKENTNQFAVLHFLIMYVGYCRIIGKANYCALSDEIEKIENKQHYWIYTKKLFGCYNMLKKYYGKDFARRILMFTRYCIHGNWKKFSIESAIYYNYLIKV